MDLQELFKFAEPGAYQPLEYQLPVKLQPFLPDYVPAIGGPNSFIGPPRPDGQPDFLGLTVLDEPALQQSDPATLALQLRHQMKLQDTGPNTTGGRGSSASRQPPLGWVANAALQPRQLDAWIEQVEVLHQADMSAAALAPVPPDLETLMQAWTPEMQAHIRSSPLPDPRQDVDLPTFARMVCSVLDLHPHTGSGGSSSGGTVRGLIEALHALFALYLEFKNNPAFQHHDAFGGSKAGAGRRGALII